MVYPPDSTLPYIFYAATLIIGWFASSYFGMGVSLPYVWLASQVRSWLEWWVLSFLLLFYGIIRGLERLFVDD